jgi:hypothetical protein
MISFYRRLGQSQFEKWVKARMIGAPGAALMKGLIVFFCFCKMTCLLASGPYRPVATPR